MTEILEILFKLIRIALGTEKNYDFPQDANWTKIISTAYEQKVSIIAADGARKAGLISKLENDPTLAEIVSRWVNDENNLDRGFEYYKQVICAIAEIFAANGLKTVVLKGIGLSGNYPIPTHRGMGDMDICLIDRNNNLAAEEGDRIAREVFGVEPEVTDHHSAFDFNGVHIENHTAMAESFFGIKGEKEYVARLNEMVLKDLVQSDFSDKIYFPSTDFNALFLMRHTFTHYYTASANLRQYCDWATFLMRFYKEIDWDSMCKDWADSGMKPFADGLHTLMSDKFNIGEFCPPFTEDLRAENSIIRNLYEQVKYCGHLPQRFRYYYANQDKLNMLTGKNWVYLFFISFWGTYKFQSNRLRKRFESK